MKQRLAIDYGRARVGVALGGMIAREYTTLQSDSHLLENLSRIITDEHVGELILGQPKRNLGEPGTLALEIDQFIKRLEKMFPNIAIFTIDEAFSTTQAEIELKEQNVSPIDIKKRVDQYAAKIILDQYNQEHGQTV